MGGLTPEGQVLSQCKDMLKRLEIMGWVKHWERMSVGMSMNMQGYRQMTGRVGSADLWAFVPVDEILHIMFFEVKREDGGIQSPAQIEFEHKFIGFHNVIYQIITDPKQIKVTVDNARKKSKNYGKIEEWELPKELI